MLSTLGARSFYAAASTPWTSLPANIRTHLFNLAYNEYLFLGVVNCIFSVVGFIDISYN